MTRNRTRMKKCKDKHTDILKHVDNNNNSNNRVVLKLITKEITKNIYCIKMPKQCIRNDFNC